MSECGLQTAVVSGGFRLLLPGRLTVTEADRLQERLRAEVAAGGRDTIVGCDHPPTISCGISTRPEDLPLAPDTYAARGIAIERIDRGGRCTWHGPGQAVVYCVADLRRLGMRPRELVERLERAAIRFLVGCGVPAWTDEAAGHGVYAGHGKIAAVGIGVCRGISKHGLALNLTVDPAVYRLFAPCGRPGLPVSSLHLECPAVPPAGESLRRLATAVADSIEGGGA